MRPAGGTWFRGSWSAAATRHSAPTGSSRTFTAGSGPGTTPGSTEAYYSEPSPTRPYPRRGRGRKHQHAAPEDRLVTLLFPPERGMCRGGPAGVGSPDTWFDLE